MQCLGPMVPEWCFHALCFCMDFFCVVLLNSSAQMTKMTPEELLCSVACASSGTHRQKHVCEIV